MKTCKRCERELPISEFYKHKGMADGYLSFCKECTRKRVAKHRERNLDSIRAADRRRGCRKTPAHKASARKSVFMAVARGELIKPEKCQRCDATGKICAHHDDYSKPLSVEWLCYSCHGLVHRK